MNICYTEYSAFIFIYLFIQYFNNTNKKTAKSPVRSKSNFNGAFTVQITLYSIYLNPAFIIA